LQVNDDKAPFPGDEPGPIKLHVYLDGSVLEVFANGTTVLTARVYQVPSTPLRLVLKGDAELIGVQVWQMEPISKDRLTGSLCG
jgi:sucrose-6-phosphate hydrolase SacC (GH32 family)